MSGDEVILVIDCGDCDDCKASIKDGPQQHKFTASKNNLCRESSYFQAMFHGGFAEGSKDQVKIAGVSVYALEQVINYSNGIELQFQQETALQTLEAAGMMQFINLQKQCCHFLVHSLSIDNVIDAIEAAEHLNIEELFSKAFSYILWHFPEVIESANFPRITFKTFQRIIDSPGLRVTKESIVYQAISKWIKNEEEEGENKKRKGQLADLLKCIRPSDLTDAELKEFQLSSLPLEPEDQIERELPLFPCCIGRYKKSPYVFLFDPDQSKLEPFLTLTGKATSNGVTACGFQVGSSGTSFYVFGGEFSLGRGNWNKTVWSFDTMTEEWTQVLTLENPRRHHSLAFTEDKFYIMGGFGKHRVILDRVECFSKGTGKLHDCQSLPSSLFSVASFCHEGKLYVLKNQYNSLVYDPGRNEWEKAFTHVEFPPGVEFNFAMPYKEHVYVTTQHSYKLYRFPLLCGDADQKDKIKMENVGEFQHETQNVCIVGSVIYNFSSDQFAYYSTIESFDIEEGKFELLFKTEDEEIDFSPYFSFGCFPIVKYPTFKIAEVAKKGCVDDK